MLNSKLKRQHQQEFLHKNSNLPASPSPYSAIESLSSLSGGILAPLLKDALLGARLLPTLNVGNKEMMKSPRSNSGLIAENSVRLRVFVESGVLVEIFTTVSGLSFVDGILSTPVPFNDADKNQDQEQ